MFTRRQGRYLEGRFDLSYLHEDRLDSWQAGRFYLLYLCAGRVDTCRQAGLSHLILILFQPKMIA